MAIPVTPNELQQYVLQARGDSFGGGWQERNFPLGHDQAEEKNTCPHTELLVEAAGLVGITPVQIQENARRFCGQHVVDVNDLGPLSGRQGTEYHPDPFCQRIYGVLERIHSLEDFEPIPIKIGEDGSLEVTLSAASIEEMDGLYQKLRLSVTKAHFQPCFDRAKTQLEKLLEIFGQPYEFKPVVLRFLPERKGVAFVPRKGCPLAPKEDFYGAMA